MMNLLLSEESGWFGGQATLRRMITSMFICKSKVFQTLVCQEKHRSLYFWPHPQGAIANTSYVIPAQVGISSHTKASQSIYIEV
jgi:hypothetical protein